jgi:hypothetical protein
MLFLAVITTFVEVDQYFDKGHESKLHFKTEGLVLPKGVIYIEALTSKYSRVDSLVIKSNGTSLGNIGRSYSKTKKGITSWVVDVSNLPDGLKKPYVPYTISAGSGERMDTVGIVQYYDDSIYTYAQTKREENTKKIRFEAAAYLQYSKNKVKIHLHLNSDPVIDMDLAVDSLTSVLTGIHYVQYIDALDLSVFKTPATFDQKLPYMIITFTNSSGDTATYTETINEFKSNDLRSGGFPVMNKKGFSNFKIYPANKNSEPQKISIKSIDLKVSKLTSNLRLLTWDASEPTDDISESNVRILKNGKPHKLTFGKDYTDSLTDNDSVEPEYQVNLYCNDGLYYKSNIATIDTNESLSRMVYLISNPSGAHIFINDTPIGNTPIYIYREMLEPINNVVLKMPDWDDTKLENTESCKEDTILVELTKIIRKWINTDPPEASVYLDDSLLGNTPLNMILPLSAISQKVTLRKMSYMDKNLTFIELLTWRSDSVFLILEPNGIR